LKQHKLFHGQRLAVNELNRVFKERFIQTHRVNSNKHQGNNGGAAFRIIDDACYTSQKSVDEVINRFATTAAR